MRTCNFNNRTPAHGAKPTLTERQKKPGEEPSLSDAKLCARTERSSQRPAPKILLLDSECRRIWHCSKSDLYRLGRSIISGVTGRADLAHNALRQPLRDLVVGGLGAAQQLPAVVRPCAPPVAALDARPMADADAQRAPGRRSSAAIAGPPAKLRDAQGASQCLIEFVVKDALQKQATASCWPQGPTWR